MILLKSEREIRCMREAGRIVAALDAVGEIGRTWNYYTGAFGPVSQKDDDRDAWRSSSGLYGFLLASRIALSCTNWLLPFTREG